MTGRILGGKSGGDDSEVSRQNGSHAQRSQTFRDFPGKHQARVDQMLRNRRPHPSRKILEQPPWLMCRCRKPCSNFLVGVPKSAQRGLVDSFRAGIQKHLIDPVKSQRVDLALPVIPTPEGSRVAVIRIIQGKAVLTIGSHLYRCG